MAQLIHEPTDDSARRTRSAPVPVTAGAVAEVLGGAAS